MTRDQNKMVCLAISPKYADILASAIAISLKSTDDEDRASALTEIWDEIKDQMGMKESVIRHVPATEVPKKKSAAERVAEAMASAAKEASDG